MHALRQRFALEQFHDDEQLVVRLGDVVDLADIGMADAGRDAGFAPEAGMSIAQGSSLHKLDGYRAVQPLVVRGVNHAHTALAQLPSDAVLRQPFDHGISSWSTRSTISGTLPASAAERSPGCTESTAIASSVKRTWARAGVTARRISMLSAAE